MRCGWVLQKGKSCAFRRIGDIADRYTNRQCSDEGVYEDFEDIGSFRWVRWLCDFHKCWLDRMREKHLEWAHDDALADNHNFNWAMENKAALYEFEK